METREHEPVKEYEGRQAIIKLEFFRHDEKAKSTAGGDRTGDEFIRLTPAGREHATQIGKTKKPNVKTAVAFSSERERATETSLRHMLSNEDEITKDMSLEDIRSKIGEQMTVGKKNKTIRQLNFDWDSNPEFAKVAYPRYTESKDALFFLKDESDELVRKLKDQVSDSYSRSAGDFAELTKKYIKILPRWKKILAEKREDYSQTNNEMQRFFGTHQTVPEPFLMKIIEKTQGSEKVEDFIKSLKTANGFEPSQGYSVIITDKDNKPSISLVFEGKEVLVTTEILDEIIAERDALNKEIAFELDNDK